MSDEAAAATTDFCALCGDAVPADRKEQFILDGSVCAKCAVERAAAKKRKLMPLALFAILAAVVPLLLSFATTRLSDGQSVTVTTSTRILFFSSSNSNGLDFHVAGTEPGPMTRSYSDPVAIACGGLALLLGLAGAALAMRAKNQRSLFAGLIAALFGALHLLHGLGTI